MATPTAPEQPINEGGEADEETTQGDDPHDGEASFYPFDQDGGNGSLPPPPYSHGVRPSLGPRTASRIDEHGAVWCEEHKAVENPFQIWLGRAKMVFFGHKKPRDPQGGVADRKDFGWLIIGGSILCYVAGWVNAFAIISAKTTVSHVTGSTTKAGMSFASGDIGYLIFAFGLWACFVLGGAFSGIIIYNDTFALGRSYGHAFLIISAFLFWASIWAVQYPNNLDYVFVLAIAMGIQNGVTTRYSGNVVRTTHLTGLSTDVGITIGHVLRCHPKPDRWKLKMYFPMLICFFFGAATARAAFNTMGRASLFFPSIFLLLLGLGYIIFLARLRKQPFHKVLLRRVSNEIMTPVDPSRARFKNFHLPHMPHMPNIHLPNRYMHHHTSSRSSKGHGVHGNHLHAQDQVQEEIETSSKRITPGRIADAV